MRKGLVKEAEVDLALFNTISVQMRLGMFDGEPSSHPYGSLGPRDVCTPSHQELALEAARQGIVLLKNEGPALPLSPRRHHPIAVVGPNSDVTLTMIGNYAGNKKIKLVSLCVFVRVFGLVINVTEIVIFIFLFVFKTLKVWLVDTRRRCKG